MLRPAKIVTQAALSSSIGISLSSVSLHSELTSSALNALGAGDSFLILAAVASSMLTFAPGHGNSPHVMRIVDCHHVTEVHQNVLCTRGIGTEAHWLCALVQC